VGKGFCKAPLKLVVQPLQENNQQLKAIGGRTDKGITSFVLFNCLRIFALQNKIAFLFILSTQQYKTQSKSH